MASVAPVPSVTSGLSPEFADLNPAALRSHFRSRRDVSYFAVLDEEATEPRRIDDVVEGRFEFNHETHELPDPVDWLSNPSVDIEWHILLHKFYYAPGLGLAFSRSGDHRYVERWVQLTTGWIGQTPPGYIASDVTGRRIQNWIYAFYYFVEHGDAELPRGFLRLFLQSLAEQVEYLVHNLAPARNHRTLELYAIFLAGTVFPELESATRWQQFAFTELQENMKQDLLPDGVHCELSTDYHHIVLRNLLCVRRLAAANDIRFPADADLLLERALEFSMHVHRPDGIVPALSDGDARGYRKLLRLGYDIYGREDFLYVATAGRHGTRPNDRSRLFRDSGYCVLRSGWGGPEAFEDERYLVFDCGPLGEGNHGHLDLLSIEAAAYGKPLVVDPGRYTYDESGPINWRVRFRGTAYHNTVLVDGRNQTAYTPGQRRYKVREPRAEHQLLAYSSSSVCDIVHGRARSFQYEAVHQRCVFFVAGAYWFVSDWLFAGDEHRYEQLFHLAPHMLGQVRTGRDGVIKAPGLALVQREPSGSSAAIDEGYVSTAYGRRDAAPVVRFTTHGSNCRFDTALVPHGRLRPDVRLSAVHVTQPDGADAGHWCTRVTTLAGGRRFDDLLFARPGEPDGPLDFAGFRYYGRYLALRIDDCGACRVLHIDADARLVDNRVRAGAEETS